MDDIRKTQERSGPRTGSGSGAAYDKGYGAGGLGGGEGQARPWDAPGVTPDGRRTGSSMEGPRIATDGEGEPDAERFGDDDLD
jgi:hypothetical protein